MKKKEKKYIEVEEEFVTKPSVCKISAVDSISGILRGKGLEDFDTKDLRKIRLRKHNLKIDD